MKELVATLGRQSKKPLAIFLGAGASRPFGYPITRDLMRQILSNLKKVAAKKGARNPRVDLHDFLGDLLPGERVSRQAVPLVTGVLSLLDHSLLTGQLLVPETTIEHTRAMRQELEWELVATIPDNLPFNECEEARFDIYCGWLSDILKKRTSGIGVITSNYDMLSDLSAFYVANVKGEIGDWDYEGVARKIDFGFRWCDPYKNLGYPRPSRSRFALYKLHGSTNWLRCPLCESVFINPDGPIASLAKSAKVWRGNVCNCSDTKLDALIVSPSFVRTMRDPSLFAVWKNALDLLRASDHWVIIGYGFPDEDVGVRALFTRAFGSQNHRRRVSVIQFDDSAKQNYESFFPTSALGYYTGGLEALLEVVG